MPNQSGPNKRMNGPDGRARNTSTSNAGRAPGVPQGLKPPTIPGFGGSYGSVPSATAGAASSWAALQNVMAGMRAKRAGLKAGFKTDRAGIRSAAIGAMSDAINQGIESGMTGSSDVSQQRVGVIADRRQQIEAAKTAMKQGVIDTKVAEQQQFMDYTIAQEQMQMQAEAARQQAAIAAAQLQAQEAGNASIAAAIAGMRGGGAPRLKPGVTVLGRAVTMDPKGNLVVAGMKFKPDTPVSAIEAAIQSQLAENTRAGNRIDWAIKGQR